MIVLAFDEYPSQTFKANLDNLNYYFKMYWNDRGEFWGLDLMDESKNPIVSGIKVVLNYDLFQDYHCYAVPPGRLMITDPSGDESKIAYGDFLGTRGLLLMYITEVEIAPV